MNCGNSHWLLLTDVKKNPILSGCVVPQDGSSKFALLCILAIYVSVCVHCGCKLTISVEELVSGVRQAADFAEQFRSYSESEKQWKARMEFILRHLPDYRDPPDGGGRLDQLLSLSMVWANHLFLGCSYNKDLLDKVMEMANGIEVEDLPHFTTRGELMKKHQL